MSDHILVTLLDQGDETLVFGGAILTALEKGNTVSVAIMGGGYDPEGAVIAAQSTPDGGDGVKITPHEAGKGRDREAFAACQTLGVAPHGIALASKRLKGTESAQSAAKQIAKIAAERGVSRILTYSPWSNHAPKRLLAQAAAFASLEQPWPSLQFAQDPLDASEAEVMRCYATPKMLLPSGSEASRRIASALAEYGMWDPERGRYALLARLKPGHAHMADGKSIVFEFDMARNGLDRLFGSLAMESLAQQRQRGKTMRAVRQEMENSTAWRTGLFLTAVPRALKDSRSR